MPEMIESYDDARRIYISYAIYTKEEIRKEWTDFKQVHFAHMRKDKPYVTCTVNCEDEALVLAALMMRRANVGPQNFCYDECSMKLLVSCPMNETRIPPLQHIYESIISIFLGEKNLRYMDRDPVGKRLFNNGTLDVDEVIAKTTYKGIIPWTGKLLNQHIDMIDNIGGCMH